MYNSSMTSNIMEQQERMKGKFYFPVNNVIGDSSAIIQDSVTVNLQFSMEFSVDAIIYDINITKGECYFNR